MGEGTPSFILGGSQAHSSKRMDGICPALTQQMGTGGNNVPMHNVDVRIRKLTPKECVRLMGFDDSDYYAMASVNSDTQIYKQCGNSIVVSVLEAIFKEML